MAGPNRPEPYFNRERFLLRLVALVLLTEFGLWGLLGFSCAFVFLYKSTVVKVYDPTCKNAGVGFKDAADSSLSVLLALLGGGAMAADEIKRRAKKTKEEEEALPPGSDESQAG